MKIFLVKTTVGAIYEDAWAASLRRIGHDVHVFDVNKLLGQTFSHKVQNRLIFGPAITKMRNSCLAAARIYKPDLIVIYQGHQFDAETIQNLSKVAWVTGYHNDNPFSARNDRRHYLRYREYFNSLKYYDSYHCFRYSNIEDYVGCGIRNVGLLMGYYIPEYDNPSVKFNEKYNSSVIFAGHPEPDERIEYIEYAASNVDGFRLYGDGKNWSKALSKIGYANVEPVNHLIGDYYRQALKSSKICLSFFSNWNRDSYTTRVFEIPAVGSFLFSKRTNTMLELYKEGVEAEFFDSLDEFKSKIRFYLKDDSSRQSIALNGHYRAIKSGYDIDSRMTKFTEDILEWKKN